VNLYKRTPTCLLHNSRTCVKNNIITEARQDQSVRIVIAYDWGAPITGIELIKTKIDKIFNGLKEDYPVTFIVRDLRGKDGVIFCDICRQIRSADIAIFEMSTYNLNVIFELGLAVNAGNYVMVVRSKHYKKRDQNISDLAGQLEYRYTTRNHKLKFEADFASTLTSKLRIAAKHKII
jgi:hypothetical protein